ncbi:zinc finger protein 800b [Triplophysa rosa]
MEEPMSDACTTPANEKSCQTDDLMIEAVVPGPDLASKTLVNSTEMGDPPLLLRPLQTSKSGIEQIIACFRTGTAELKHILLKEVDTIFECKLCRSLFRGLPNLIKHKEIYCFSRLSQPDDSSGDGEKSIKELLEAIYPRSEKQEYFMRLEPIAGNQNAVYQYVSSEEDLPPSSQSPEHTNTDDWSHVHLHEPNTEMKEGEDHCVKEEERASVNKDDEDDEGSEEHQVSSEDRTEEADVSDSSSCRCRLCNRTYKVRGRLQRHLRIVHKIITSSEPTSNNKKTNGKVPESPDANTSDSQKSPREENKVPWKPTFSAGFDLKTRFCKLCRRTFSSEQNLAKHIELHTDNGSDFFVKFYCCPMCSYRTRRKRDVVRHLSDFHKKNSTYLSRISQSLESSAIKTPAKDVLNKKKPKMQQEVKLHSSPYLTRRNHNAPRKTPGGEKGRSGVKVKRDSGEGKVMQPLSVCGVCGQGFRKQRHLDLHMRSHQKTAGRRAAAGVRTRSKVMH